jgi:putative ABC transport system permease protein
VAGTSGGREAGPLSASQTAFTTLVSIGTYGLVSFSIARRAREICIRIAIGASQANILRVTLGRVLLMCVGGAAAGLAVAFFGAPLISPLLFGVHPRDPAACTGGFVLLALVTLAATWWPTRRALHSEPASLLRQG